MNRSQSNAILSAFRKEARAELAGHRQATSGLVTKTPRRKRLGREIARLILADYYAGGMTQRAIAKKHGTTPPTVNYLVKGKVYKELVSQISCGLVHADIKAEAS